MNSDGRAVRQLTFPPNGTRDEEPVWSPDGKQVAFQRTQGDRTLVFVVSAKGGRPREVGPCTAGCAGEDSPAWAPGGSRLAIGIMARGGGESVWIVKPSGHKLRRVTQANPAHIDTQPSWSPNGKQLTFTRKTEQPAPDGRLALFVIGVDGKGERRLSPWRLRAGHHPDWSPGGRRILFTSNADQAEDDVPSDIYSVRPDGTGLAQLTHAQAGQQYYSAAFSPDGRWITVGLRPGKDVDERVFVIRLNGGDAHPLTPAKSWNGAPDWTGSARRRRAAELWAHG